MSETDLYRSELAALIDALFEGTLSAEQAEQVTRAVAEDPAAAELYWDYVELQAELRRIHRDKSASFPDDRAVPVLPDVCDLNDPLTDVSEPSGQTTPGGGITNLFGLPSLVWGGLLCFCGVAILIGWLVFRGEPAVGTRSSAIAHVTSMSDCTWSDPNAQDRCSIGLPLSPGEHICIENGSVQLTYDNGVVVTLNGPASYRVIDEQYGFLQDGFALARVPENAVGFTINTPAGKIIDCGTEFGVTVGRDEKTGVVTADVRVIDGAVDINLSSPSGKGTQRKRFLKGEAMRMSSLNNGPKHADANDVFDPRTIPGLRLWLNADAGVLRGPDDRVTEMIDLIGDANENAENARQPVAESRPRWHSGTINRRPTLVFEGKQYIQLPSQKDLNFQEESLSIFVVGNASGGTQYFLSSRVDGENNDPKGFRLTSSTEGGIRYQAAGVTVIKPCDITRHAVFSVIHDRRMSGANTVTLYRNGHQLGPVVKVGNSNISNAFPLTIGANLEAIHKYPKATRNYLRGELGEILIYDRVLSPEQRGKVEAYLVRKYGFENEVDSKATGATGSSLEYKPAIKNAHSD